MKLTSVFFLVFLSISVLARRLGEMEFSTENVYIDHKKELKSIRNKIPT